MTKGERKMNGKTDLSPDTNSFLDELSSRESLSHSEEGYISQKVDNLTLSLPAVQKNHCTNGNEKRYSLSIVGENFKEKQFEHSSLNPNSAFKDVKASASLEHLHQSKSPGHSSRSHNEEFYRQKRIREYISPSPHRSEINRAQMKTDALQELSECYRGILASVGEDTKRHGLLKTPERAAKAMLYFTKGYDEEVSGEFKYFRSNILC